MRNQRILKLPKPQSEGKMTLEEALSRRRTTRNFSSKEVDLPIISKLLWALQGITNVENLPERKKVFHRAAPSAGMTYPLEAYVVFSSGLYHYEPREHVLCLVNGNDIRESLSEAAMTPLNKEAIKIAPLTIILAADNDKALKATPLLENAVRFAHLEAGHATQNLMLQAVSLGLGVCTVTSYKIEKVYEVLKLPRNHRPIYLLPIGFPKEKSKTMRTQTITRNTSEKKE
jgi:SagB-type dehydrogenase family enzyme